MKTVNSLFAKTGVTVFETMSRLAMETGAINLGQGFPDELGPENLRRAAAQAIMEGPNQYPPMLGVAALRQAVAEHGQRFYALDVDWQSETMVTSGATEAISDALMALIEPGDEVVLIEPLYDCYLPLVRRAGGIPRLVRIEPPHWDLPRDALAQAFSENTKLILLNTPHNPAAKVFSRDDLQFIADLIIEHDTYALCDEVYEHILFDDCEHVSLITLPGMRDRCIKIGSAGKTFSMTGWKVGYLTAAPALLTPISKAHQFTTFTTPPNFQTAAAVGLRQGDEYFRQLAGNLQQKRDRLVSGLETIGFVTLPTEGTYFLSVDIRSVGFTDDDVAFCETLARKAGVAAIPMSAFYQQGEVNHYVRFCFSKRDEVLDAALEKLQAFFGAAGA